MTPKKAKNVPVEEEVKEEVAPVEEEVVEETPVEVPAEVEKESEDLPDPVNVEIPVEERAVEEEHHNVAIEAEKKQFSILWAPEEIQKIITFYGVTSQDLFDGNVDNMGLKADELKALKEWYATLE